MNNRFEFITYLQYKVKSLQARVDAFESGDRYVAMQKEFNQQLSQKDREIQKCKQELCDAHRLTATIRKNWMQVNEDLEKELEKERALHTHQIKMMETKLSTTKDALSSARKELLKKKKESYAVQTELEEERGRNHKLQAQMDRDFENSSLPSSMKMNRKKISNNREKTGKRPGGQPGHKGHGRRKLTPTQTIEIPAPQEYVEDPKFRMTSKTITKQLIHIRMQVIVDEYNTPEFRNRETGQRVHAAFPDGVVNDVNYGGSVKAFSFLLNSRYCVSTDKVREFLCELTNGELQISNGMINGLCKTFSEKTAAEQKAIFADLLISPVMNTDLTSARLNGKNVQVVVCATPQRALYFAREHKGHEGVKGTPVEDYQGILVHDHDPTFYNYGTGHQECLAHPLRYLKDSMTNEPNLEWNKQMYTFLREMIHDLNGLGEKKKHDEQQVKRFEDRYEEILALAEKEYEYEPPTDYYKEGFNLYKKFDKYMDNHLLCLHDRRVPTSNNLAERLLRVFKRILKQAMTFRSFDRLGYLCDSLGMIESFRLQSKNLFSNSSAIFDR